MALSARLLDDLLKGALKTASSPDDFRKFASIIMKVSDEFAQNLHVAMTGTDASKDVGKIVDDFIKTGNEAREMTPEQVEAITSPSKKAEVENFRALKDDEWAFTARNDFKLSFTRVQGEVLMRSDIENAFFSGKSFDIDAIAGTRNVRDATDVAEAKAFAKALTDKKEIDLKALTNAIKNSRADEFEGMDPQTANTILRADAEKQWLAIYSKNTPEAKAYRDYFTGKINDTELKTTLDQNKGASKPNANTAQPATANAGKADDATAKVDNATPPPAAATVVDPAQKKNIFNDNFVTRGWDKVWGGDSRSAKVTRGVVKYGSGIATVMWVGDSLIDIMNGDDPEAKSAAQKQKEANPLDLDSINEVEDIGDAKSMSKSHMNHEQEVMEKFNAAITSMKGQALAIENAINLERSLGNTDAVKALETLKTQVDVIIRTHVKDPSTQLQETEEGALAYSDAVKEANNTIQALDKNAPLSVAHSLLEKQQTLLNGIHSSTVFIERRNQKIAEAIRDASGMSPVLSDPPIHTVELNAMAAEEKRLAETKEKIEKEAAALVKNASTPGTSISDAHSKSLKNIELAGLLTEGVETILDEARSNGPNSLSKALTDAIAYEQSKGNAAAVENYEKLKLELDSFIAKAGNSLTEVQNQEARVKTHGDTIKGFNNEHLRPQANKEILAQGQIIQDMHKIHIELAKDFTQLEDAFAKGMTVASLQQQAAQTPVTGGQQQQPVTGGQQQQQPVTGGQQQQPAVPQAILTMIADGKILASYSGGKGNPATLSDGQTKVEFGAGPILVDLEQLHERTRRHIAEIETLQINLNKEGKGAEAAELNNMLRDMRNNERLYHSSIEGVKAASVEIRDAINRMEKYTQGADLSKATTDLALIKDRHAAVVTILQNVDPVQQNQMQRMKNHALTEPIIRKDTSVYEQDMGSLLKTIGGGKEGLPYRVFGDKGSDGMTVAGSYLSIAWNKVNDLHDGWKRYGRSMSTQGGQTGWMVADTAGKVVLGAIALNLFNNTLGAAAGFQISGWKRFAVLGLIAAIAVHGTGETGREMNDAIRSRNDTYGNGPLAQVGSGSGKIAGTNIPNTYNLNNPVNTYDQKTGEKLNVVNLVVTDDYNVNAGLADGRVVTLDRIDAASLDADVTNRSQGNGRNTPSNMDMNKLVSVPNTDTNAANDEVYGNTGRDRAPGMAAV